MVAQHNHLIEKMKNLIGWSLNCIEIPSPITRGFLNNRPNPAYRHFFDHADSFTFPSLFKPIPGQKYIITRNLFQNLLLLFHSHVLSHRKLTSQGLGGRIRKAGKPVSRGEAPGRPEEKDGMGEWFEIINYAKNSIEELSARE
jgi:hypothetical protein